MRKGPNITNEKFFSITSKMGTAYGFHIDLKFQACLPWLSGLQMSQTPRITRLGPAPTRMFESGILDSPMVFHEYLQLWKVVDLKYLQFCVDKTTLFPLHPLFASKLVRTARPTLKFYYCPFS